MAIVTLADVRAHLNLGASETGDDVELQRFIDAVTTPLEREMGRVIEPRTITDEITVPGTATTILLRSVPVISLTSLASMDGTRSWSVDPASVHVDSESGCVTSLVGPAFTGRMLALYQAGMTTVTPNVRLAALITIGHLWETQRGSAGAVPGGGDLDFVPGRGFALPRRALELLDTTLPGVA